jgi:hypothetical protein
MASQFKQLTGEQFDDCEREQQRRRHYVSL